MKEVELKYLRILIALYDGYILQPEGMYQKLGAETVDLELRKDDEFNYDKSWDMLIPVYNQFAEEAEKAAGNNRSRISFCCDFMHGVNYNKIDVAFNSLTEGIKWLNKWKCAE